MALALRSPLLGVAQHPALWSPDFPRSPPFSARDRDHPVYSPKFNGSLVCSQCLFKDVQSRIAWTDAGCQVCDKFTTGLRQVCGKFLASLWYVCDKFAARRWTIRNVLLAIIEAAEISDIIKLLENFLRARVFMGGMTKTVSNYS